MRGKPRPRINRPRTRRLARVGNLCLFTAANVDFIDIFLIWKTRFFRNLCWIKVSLCIQKANQIIGHSRSIYSWSRGGRGWYTVVLLFYDLCLWPHLLYLMVSCEDSSPSLLPPSGITLTEHPSVSKSYALCNQSEIEDLSANRYRALCSILIFYCSFRTVFASRPIASDVRWWLSRPESHPMVKKFSRPSARRKKHYKKLKVIFYPSGKI